MKDLISSARIKYEFLNEKSETKTDSIKNLKTKSFKNTIKLKENFYIPNFLSRLYEVKSCQILDLGIKQKINKCGSVVFLNYALSCIYKSEFFMDQRYTKCFSKMLKFDNIIDLKNAKLNISNYEVFTERFLKIYLIFDF